MMAAVIQVTGYRCVCVCMCVLLATDFSGTNPLAQVSRILISEIQV